MPNYELCRANLGFRERLNQINEATRHNQRDFKRASRATPRTSHIRFFSRPNRLGVGLDKSIVSREVG
jgi:hypothetical protein